MTKHTVTRALHTDGLPYVDNVFSYRGVLFERDDSRKGYYGHYKVLFNAKMKITTSTRTKLLSEIDIVLDSKV